MNATTTVKMFQRAVALNYEGVALLRRGDCYGAHKTLKEGLDAMKELSRFTAHDESRSSQTSFVSGQAPIPHGPCPMESADRFSIYDHAFVINPACLDSETQVPSAEAVSIASSVILFNMALMYHLRGMQAQDPTKLNKAASLYNTCVSLVTTNTWEKRHDARLILVAAMNNQVQMHSVAGNAVIAGQLHEQFKALFPVVSQLRQWCGSQPVLDEVVLNMTVGSTTTATAAAA